EARERWIEVERPAAVQQELVARRELVLEQTLRREEIGVAPEGVRRNKDVIPLEQRAGMSVDRESVRHVRLDKSRARYEAVPRGKVGVDPDDVVMKAERSTGAVDDGLPHRSGARRVAEASGARDRLELREIESPEDDSQIGAGQTIEDAAFLTIADERADRRLTHEVAPNAKQCRHRV